MHRLRTLLCLGVAALGTPSEPVRAEVGAAGPGEFVSVNSVVVGVASNRAFDGLVEVARWWDPAHTFSGDAANLSLNPFPGGCLCGKLPGGGVEHLRVVFTRAGRTLRLVGALGPLQEQAVVGVLGFSLEPMEGGTTITLTYRVAGYIQGGLEAWADPVDRVLAGQLRRLQSFLDEAGVE
jgi:hypothetical protein